jgi:hypothetical protein
MLVERAESEAAMGSFLYHHNIRVDGLRKKS